MKMKAKDKFIDLSIILCVYLGSFSFSKCDDQTPNCSNDAFQCGSISYISYPFWGGTRTLECGRQGFELICHNNIPTLTISSLSFRVLQLDFSTNTLTISRQDLQNTSCPKPPHNTTIDWDLFRYPPNSTDRNLTLYFHCKSQETTSPNNFSCDDETSINLFKINGDHSALTSCNSNIYVPVNSKDAESLQNPSPSSINIMRSALTTGFSIQWFNDSRQFTSPYCDHRAYGGNCEAVVGGTGISTGTVEAIPNVCCYAMIGREDAAPVSNDAPPVPSLRSTPPFPSPTQSPAANGLPPVPSTGYPPQSPNINSQIDKGRKHAKEIGIVVALPVVAGIIIVSISIKCFLKRRHSANIPAPECKQDVEKFLLQQGSLTPKRYKYSEMKKITRSFSDKLGQGAYGSVYKGMLPDGRLVAVKVLIESSDSSGEEFINEVASISRTSHVNIVTLLGFCYEGNRRALVYDFMPNYSLDKFLNHNQSTTAGMDCHELDSEKLYKIAVGAAKGLEYLHTGCTTRIVHFDIKPQNILLDQDFCPKISDFGLAKLCKKKQSILSMLGTRGTAGYIAPEVFSRNFGAVSHKSDVYSYGMMLLDMVGARKLAEAEVIQSSDSYFPDKIYEQVISDVAKKLDDLMIKEEEETTSKMFMVGFWCIQTIPSSRPSISKVVEMLEGSLQSIQIPPKPFLFSPNLPMHEISSSETENSVHD